MKKLFYILILSLLSLTVSFCGDSKMESLKKVFSSQKNKYALIIDKRQFTLDVYNSDLEKIVSYKIGYAHNQDMKPKLYEGDDRTPEGVYEINEILSIDAGKESESYRKLLNMNKVYFKKSKGYHKYNDPESDLGDNAYGPRYYGINYPNPGDKKRYDEALSRGEIPIINGKPAEIGYGIAIHGNNDEESIGHLCSSGCIRMYNKDVVDLEKYIVLSTPVIIIKE